LRFKGDAETIHCMIFTGVHFRRAGALAAAMFLTVAQDAAADGLRAG